MYFRIYLLFLTKTEIIWDFLDTNRIAEITVEIVMILNELHPGERGRVTGIEGGHRLRQKLALRGIAEGCVLTMVSSSCGPVAVEVRGSTLALGRCMARHIQVVMVE